MWAVSPEYPSQQCCSEWRRERNWYTKERYMCSDTQAKRKYGKVQWMIQG
jgi:hypothetical protein